VGDLSVLLRNVSYVKFPACTLEGKVAVRGYYSNVGTQTVVIKVIPGGGSLA
jgi:hypothetical protein